MVMKRNAPFIMMRVLRLIFSVLLCCEAHLPFARGERLCNGHADLCSRKYSNITFIGTHDSAFIGELPSQNQIKSLAEQLEGGIRFLQSQVHLWDVGQTFGSLFSGLREVLPDVPVMCHTSCALAFGGTVHDYLQTVKEFLDDNPDEIVTLLFTNPDKIPMEMLNQVFRSVKLDSVAYKPTGSNVTAIDQWPTLGDMIANNQRIVVFIGKCLQDLYVVVLMQSPDYGADGTVPFLLDEFKYYWETPFNTLDPLFAQCDMDRVNTLDKTGKSSMNIVNHFLDIQIPCTDILIPYRCMADSTNAVDGEGSIAAQAGRCRDTHGRNPNVILIDFFGKGDAISAQRVLNGL